MAVTAAEYLADITPQAQRESTLPICAPRGFTFQQFDQDLPDPHNNVGRFCTVRPRWNFMDDLDPVANHGRPFQIIRYTGSQDWGGDYDEPTYLVVHIDDPDSYGMKVPQRALTNLW